jgi:hypothetical protein
VSRGTGNGEQGTGNRERGELETTGVPTIGVIPNPPRKRG